MEAFESLAQILRTDKDIIQGIDAASSAASGKTGCLEAVESDRQSRCKAIMAALGVADTASALDLWSALERKVASDEMKLKQEIGVVEIKSYDDWKKVLAFTYAKVNPSQGWFLKHSKAEEFLRANPPQHLVSFLGYTDIGACLAKENLVDVFASVRFAEDKEWLNTVFFKQYETLQPRDFELRSIDARVLPERYAPLAQHFIEKKYHNLSHLKELGVLFVTPVQWHQPGEFTKVFSLSFHYLYEIQFYADITKRLLDQGAEFTKRFISMLRGDVPDPVVDLKHPSWEMTQRYLEKDDPFEIGLVIPHVNPESIHWAKAQDTMAQIAPELGLWKGADWVGALAKDDVGEDVLVSFNVVDCAMSLSDQTKKKYLYHQREALWNRMYVEYFGADKLEEFCKEHIIQGI